MRIWTLSLLLLAMSASAGDFRRPSLAYDCGRGPLDLACRPRESPGALSLPPLTHEHAYRIRFGRGGDEKARWDARAGNWARQALFWAAIVTTFLL